MNIKKMIEEQKKWIRQCEQNGKSYAGPNGPSIRKADQDRLKDLEKMLSPKLYDDDFFH